jgi:CheY-like chemotaxis protein
MIEDSDKPSQENTSNDGITTTGLNFSHKTILIIEDEPAYRITLRKLIEKHLGAQVKESPDPVHAFEEVLRYTTPDLIIIDLQMPHLSGQEALKRIRSVEHLKKVPVIACTGVSDKNIIIEMARLGVIDYIVKPYEKSTIMNRIVKALSAIK